MLIHLIVHIWKLASFDFNIGYLLAKSGVQIIYYILNYAILFFSISSLLHCIVVFQESILFAFILLTTTPEYGSFWILF